MFDAIINFFTGFCSGANPDIDRNEIVIYSRDGDMSTFGNANNDSSEFIGGLNSSSSDEFILNNSGLGDKDASSIIDWTTLTIDGSLYTITEVESQDDKSISGSFKKYNAIENESEVQFKTSLCRG